MLFIVDVVLVVLMLVLIWGTWIWDFVREWIDCRLCPNRSGWVGFNSDFWFGRVCHFQCSMHCDYSSSFEVRHWVNGKYLLNLHYVTRNGPICYLSCRDYRNKWQGKFYFSYRAYYSMHQTRSRLSILWCSRNSAV